MTNTPGTTAVPRQQSVDFLRGIVMILMALDHVRDYFTNVRYDPLDLSHTDGWLFMTRWVTHFCAPVFIFLAGTGAYLSLSRGKTKKELSGFLLSRGIWLVVLELTVIRFIWQFNVDYSFSYGQVIWAIGWSMIVLAGLIHLKTFYITAAAIGMILLHNLTDSINPSSLGIFSWPWIILHSGGPMYLSREVVFYIFYPLIPWIGVMAAGYLFGIITRMEKAQRDKLYVRLGIAMILLFILIRGINIYGDPRPWIPQQDNGKTILSFINVEKYPPSLSYLLITLGPAILSLPFLEKITGGIKNFFVLFGRVPLFYYIMHIPLAHLFAVITALVMGISPAFLFSNDDPLAWPREWGFNLGVVYLFWAAVILTLYPLMKWYAALKERRRGNKWLSYL